MLRGTAMKFLAKSLVEFDRYENGTPVIIDGQDLSLSALAAVSCLNSPVILDSSWISKNTSLDTMGEIEVSMSPLMLSSLSSSTPEEMPVCISTDTKVVPEAWARGAMLLIMNSLIREHSVIGLLLAQKMKELLDSNVIPVIPSPSDPSEAKDFSPWYYILGALMGSGNICVFDGPISSSPRQIYPSHTTLASHGIAPVSFDPRDEYENFHGTYFEASVADLALHDTIHIVFLVLVCLAMEKEALEATQIWSDPPDVLTKLRGKQLDCIQLIHKLLGSSRVITRMEMVDEDGEDLSEAFGFLNLPIGEPDISPENLSAGRNPYLDKSKSLAEKSAQETLLAEVENSLMQWKLPSLERKESRMVTILDDMTDILSCLRRLEQIISLPTNRNSADLPMQGIPEFSAPAEYDCKSDVGTFGGGSSDSDRSDVVYPPIVDIKMVETGSEEVNLELRILEAGDAIMESVRAMKMLTAAFLYEVCQDVDLRALRKEFLDGLESVISIEVSHCFRKVIPPEEYGSLLSTVRAVCVEELAVMLDCVNDEVDQFPGTSRFKVIVPLVSSHFVEKKFSSAAIDAIPGCSRNIVQRAANLFFVLRKEFFSDNCPSRKYLNRTRPVYDFVRLTLGVGLYPSWKFSQSCSYVAPNYHPTEDEKMTQIHEALSGGKLQSVIVRMLSGRVEDVVPIDVPVPEEESNGFLCQTWAYILFVIERLCVCSTGLH